MLNAIYIKSRMRKLGLNQAQLAGRCDVSREAVSNWLAGESIPRPNKLKVLAELFSVEPEALFGGEGSTPAPLIAYRTRRNRAVNGAAKSAADDLAEHFRQLVPFIRRRALFAPRVLEAPILEDAYIREAASQERARVGVSATEPLGRANLLQLHQDFGSILVPVLWGGDKAGHENALSVYLPDSKTSWVVFNLNSHDDDFNYWLAHELGHCYTLHAIQNDDGEQFAERFAQELLFPVEAAAEAYVDIMSDGSPLERANWYAGHYDVSVVTVIRQADRAAKELLGKKPTGLQTTAFWNHWNSTRHTVPTVIESLFETKKLSTEEYVLKSEDTFRTQVFRALGQWQAQEGGRSPAFIAATLNIGLSPALELSILLMKLYGAPSASVDSSNKRS